VNGRRRELSSLRLPFTEDAATGNLPFDKPYAALTRAQQERVKSQYVGMTEGDEPPFPERGLRAIYDPLVRAQGKLGLEGDVSIEVEISATGEPSSVQVLRSPSKAVTDLAAGVALLAKYKPGVCAGSACAMSFPIRFHLDASEQSAEQYRICKAAASLPDARVAACTEVADSRVTSKASRVEALFRRGQEWRAKGDQARAFADYEEALRLDPQSVETLVSRGNVYSDQGKKEAALADYSDAARLRPQFAYAFLNRAILLNGMGEKDRAMADYAEAIRLDPRNAIVFNSRGLAWRSAGDLDKSIADFDEAIRISPRYTGAFVNRGNVWRIKGSDDRAIADYDAAIAVDPGDATAFIGRGLVFRGRGELARAIGEYDHAIRLDPKSQRAYFDRGWASYYLGRFDAAAADFADSGRLNPKDAYSPLWRGMALVRAGRIELARSQAQQAAQSFEKGRWPRPVLEMLSGQLDPSALIGAADDPDAKKRGEQQCEAYFYLGDNRMQAGRRSDALALLEKAEKECPKGFTEYYGAVAEIKRPSN